MSAATIILFRTSLGWFARFTSPEVIRVFGTDTLSLSPSAPHDPALVLREMQASHPAEIVRLG